MRTVSKKESVSIRSVPFIPSFGNLKSNVMYLPHKQPPKLAPTPQVWKDVDEEVVLGVGDAG
jgi:hypothetical protein